MTYRILDTFCGAGGSGMGYHLAGFEVVGVDIAFQKHYPFEFHQADALEYIAEHGRDFDAIHASPPCQGYSSLKHLTTKEFPKLIKPVRDLLIAANKPYIIENVPGAPLNNPTILCGSMFRLGTYRHRLFETNFEIEFFLHMGHGLKQDNLIGSGEKSKAAPMVTVAGHARYAGAHQRNCIAMGIDWMTSSELAQAIPPAYTKFIGEQLISYLEAHV